MNRNLILLLRADGWLSISEHEVATLKDAIFPCGHCSLEGVAVYHNIIGQHHHVSRDELQSILSTLTEGSA